MKYFTVLTLIRFSYGLPDGAPDCVDKPVGHGGGTSPQTTPHDLTINAEKTDDGSVNIKVSAKTPFKGILITSTAAGQFKVPDGQPLKIMSCTGITHTDNEPKSEISATFVKTDPAAEAEFNMIVMRDFNTYWNDIKFS